ncbi:type II secretion system major pseudopilin GspG [Sphingomonas lenta]|uniref:Type II secretion system core protein G n=1 Tax=Sphingomonas lenta TaxID=1141887 RepID=A0A2A2SKQ5_9SPHN|nr:type II secretion system major pseudopilin GspG [Sphingomonas lenta]PAX09809.1 type II secretion system protein GspG [Sphingomonas lenta]
MRPDPRKRRRREQGFTLVELMVVIVIIGLLATIVAINVLPSGDQARVTRAKADINTIQGGLDLYKLQNGRYPSTSEGLAALVQGGRSGGYLKGSSVPQDPWGRDYLYASPGQHGEADVWSLGADGQEGGEDANADIGSWQS